MSLFLDNVKCCQFACDMLWNEMREEEAALRIICVKLQEVAEFGLKFLVEIQGENPPRTHDLNVLLPMVSVWKDCEWYYVLDKYSHTITYWGLRFNEGLDFEAHIDNITEVYKCAKCFSEWLLSGEYTTALSNTGD